MTSLTFDIHEIPFSRRGAWLNLSPVTGLHTAADDVHLVSHQTGMHAVLALVPQRDGARVESTIVAQPELLTWQTEHGEVSAVFETLDTVRVRGRGVDLRIADAASVLTPFTGTYVFRDPIDGSVVFTSYETGRRYRVTSIHGQIAVEGSEALGASARAVTARGDAWEVVIEEYETARPAYAAASSFDAAVETVRREFEDYLEAVAGWRTAATPAATLATYVMWSATVAPRGFVRRESILMSKHWMDKVWSWDHLFNALALAPADAALALDQFLAPFDHQEASGALPDSFTHSEVLYNFVKPPIHGWALARLRERAAQPVTQEQLQELYAALARWSRFWLDARRVPGHRLPHYHHGNDSGWDNSTVFDADRVVESPDLAAFLAVQLDVLADVADELQTAEGDAWRAERDNLIEGLLAELWHDGGFSAVGLHSGRRSSTSSLLTKLPIVAASLLPAEVVDAVARDIETHLTVWGPATQRVDTPEYESDGYWRGPIWAPSTVLIEDGLRASGHIELADEVSARFRRLCETSGFAENFDAVTGEGLRDRAYTWTASAYLVLARDAVLRSSPEG
jgi:glycogen debranching enzyme